LQAARGEGEEEEEAEVEVKKDGEAKPVMENGELLAASAPPLTDGGGDATDYYKDDMEDGYYQHQEQQQQQVGRNGRGRRGGGKMTPIQESGYEGDYGYEEGGDWDGWEQQQQQQQQQQQTGRGNWDQQQDMYGNEHMGYDSRRTNGNGGGGAMYDNYGDTRPRVSYSGENNLSNLSKSNLKKKEKKKKLLKFVKHIMYIYLSICQAGGLGSIPGPGQTYV
jgi:hypothetical protein